MQYHIKVVKQTDPTKDPFWIEACDDEDRFITGLGSATQEDGLKKIKEVLDHMNNEKVVHEEDYTI